MAIAPPIFNNHCGDQRGTQGAPSGVDRDGSLQLAHRRLRFVVDERTGRIPMPASSSSTSSISEDGQKLYRAADYLPVDPKVPPRDPSLRPDGVTFRAITMTPEEIDASMPKWVGIYNDLFRANEGRVDLASMRHRLYVALSIVAVALTISAPAPSRAADAALIAAAQKEGRVTWYTTQVINEFVLPIARDLSEQELGSRSIAYALQQSEMRHGVIERGAGRQDAGRCR